MKKIEVKTACGETFTLEVDTDQEIESMQEIVEALPDSLFGAPECAEDVRRMVEFLHGGKWKFSTNTDKSTYESLKGFVGAEAENVVIVPWAFYGSYRNDRCRNSGYDRFKDDIKMGGNSVWVRHS